MWLEQSKTAETVFSKLMQKISLSVLGEQASQHLFSSFTLVFLSQIFTYFPDMFNGFLTSTFLKISCIMVRISEGRYLLTVASDKFH